MDLPKITQAIKEWTSDVHVTNYLYIYIGSVNPRRYIIGLYYTGWLLVIIFGVEWCGVV